MPRVSQRRILIDWSLDGIEKDKAHIEAESLGKFLECHIETMRDRMREVITNPPEPPKDSDNSSISLTCAVTLTRLTESFSLFSSEWDNESVDWEVGLRQKLAMVAQIEARRYSRDRGGEFRIPISRDFREEIIGLGSGIFLGFLYQVVGED